MPPTGYLLGYAASEILISLRIHERATRSGRAIGDNVGFRVNLPNRDSFNPDASWYIGSPTGMKFLEGSLVSSVELPTTHLSEPPPYPPFAPNHPPAPL